MFDGAMPWRELDVTHGKPNGTTCDNWRESVMGA
jgi:hypothetical protein